MATTVFTGEQGTVLAQPGLLELGGPVLAPVLAPTLGAPAAPRARLRQRRQLRLDVELDGQPYKVYIPPDTMQQGREAPADSYQAVEVDPLLPHLGAPGVISYEDFPASTESVSALDDWTGGLAPIRLATSKDPDTYWTSTGVDGRRTHQLILGPQRNQVGLGGGAANLPGLPLRQVDFAGGVYLAAGSQVLKLQSGASWTTVYTAPATITDLNVFGVSGGSTYLLVAYGSGYAYSADGSVFTAGNQVNGIGSDKQKADLFAPVRFQLWKVVKPNKLYSCANIDNAANASDTWTSTATFIGDASQNITALSAYIVDLAIGKADGLWSIDRAGNDFPLVPELKGLADPNNASSLKLWRSGLHFNVRNGFYRYERSKLESLGLDRYRATGAAGSPLVLKVADCAPYMNELFVVLKPATGNGFYLAALHDQPWRWHLFSFDPRYVATYLTVSANAFGYPSLWWGADDGAGHYSSWNVRLPAATDNPLDDVGYPFQLGSATLQTTELAPLPDQDKSWGKVVVHCLDASPQATVSLGYATDLNIDSNTFTSMVGPQQQTSQFTLFQEWFFPGYPDMAPPTSKSIQFQLTLTTTDVAQTPVISHLVLHFKHRPQPRLRWEMQLVVEDRPAGNQHYVDRRSAVGQLHQLRNTRLKKEAVPFVDLAGDQYLVNVEKVSHRLLQKQPGGLNRYVAHLTLLELPETSDPAGPVVDG